MSTASRLKEYLEQKQVAGPSTEVSLEQPLLESGLIDSAGIFELVDFIESSFSVEIGDEEVVPENFDTINAIASFVEGKLRR